MEKSDTYRLVHPDGTEDLTNYNPIEEAKKKGISEGYLIGLKCAEANKHKVWCSECNGEDEASVCKWCYEDATKRRFTTSMNRKVCWEDGFKQGKQSVEDIKQNQLADHYQAGRKDALQEVLELIDIPKLRKDFELRIERGCFDIEAFTFVLEELKQKLHSQDSTGEEAVAGQRGLCQNNGCPDTFNLSDEIQTDTEPYIPVRLVKHFIRLLKEAIYNNGALCGKESFIEDLDNLAGDKLIEEKKE
jgi:hypothetical protein